MTMLTVTNLSAGYGDKTVLHGLSFTLSCGLTVLLGENGSGKTTLFRALSSAIRPTAGTVTLDGEDLLALSPKKRAQKMAQVFGTHQTLSGITGEDLAEMALYPSHGLFYRPDKTAKEKILSVARELGAESLLARVLEEMSAGERQLSELVAALVQDTPLLLLDEPTSSLDYNRTHEFLRKAKTLSNRKILFATLHSPELALAYADRVLLLKDGGIVAEIVPAKESAAEVEAKLRLLYPQIAVTETDGGFAVISPHISD